jgi:hypothetical protein
MRLIRCTVAVLCFLAPAIAAERSVTWTGWFADEQCASARAASGTFTKTNPECARTCILKGSGAVFVSQQEKALFRVQGSSILEHLGYRVEVQAKVDDTAKTITIQKVTQLEYEGPSCGRPQKTAVK